MIYKKRLKLSEFLIAHFISHGLGLMALSATLAGFLNEFIPYQKIMSGAYGLYKDAALTKPPALMYFIFGVASIFTLLILVRVIKSKEANINQLHPGLDSYIGYLDVIAGVVSGGIATTVVLWSGYGPIERIVIVPLLVWAATFCFPLIFLLRVIVGLGVPDVVAGRLRSVWIIVAASCVLSFFVVVEELNYSKNHVLNDFVDVPEATILATGELVDNHKFINENSFEGLYRHDPRNNKQGIDYITKNSVSVPFKEGLNEFIDEISDYNGDSPLFYDHKNQRLVATRELKTNERINLLSFYDTEEEKKNIQKLLNITAGDIKSYSEPKSERYYDFLTRNYLELGEQFQLGRFFYHHNYMLAPIVTYLQGGESVPSIYGVGLTKVFARCLNMIGGVNYQTYLSVLYSSYFVYSLLLILLVWLVWKRIEYMLFTSLFVAGSLVFQHPILLAMAPGFSPLRHVFDVLVFYALWRFLSANKTYWLCIAYVFCLGAVWWNQQSGMAMLCAVAFSMTCYVLLERANKRILFLTIVGLAAGAFVYWANQDSNLVGKYMMAGVGLPFTNEVVVFLAILAVTALAASVFLYAGKERDKDFIRMQVFVMALVAYVGVGVLYVLWYPSLHHIFPVVVPWGGVALTGVIWLFLNRKAAVSNDVEVIAAFSLPMVLVLMVGILINVKHQYEYRQVFGDHKIYKWDFNGSGFKTTMDPEPFENALGIIRKYGGERCVTMISRYDVILPVLANKCISGPFVTNTDILITSKETNAVINQIKKSAPTHIFVDSDVDRSFLGDIPLRHSIVGMGVSNSTPIMNLHTAQGRAATLRDLRKIYDGIAEDYEPVEVGELITAYRRKQK